jgi:hypothetical protein
VTETTTERGPILRAAIGLGLYAGAFGIDHRRRPLRTGAAGAHGYAARPTGGSCGRPDRVCGRFQVGGCDMGHRHCLAGSESGDLGVIGQPPRGGVRHKGSLVRLSHGHLTAHPRATDADGRSP